MDTKVPEEDEEMCHLFGVTDDFGNRLHFVDIWRGMHCGTFNFERVLVRALPQTI